MKSIEIGERRDQIPGKKYCPLRLGFRRLRVGVPHTAGTASAAPPHPGSGGYDAFRCLFLWNRGHAGRRHRRAAGPPAALRPGRLLSGLCGPPRVCSALRQARVRLNVDGRAPLPEPWVRGGAQRRTVERGAGAAYPSHPSWCADPRADDLAPAALRRRLCPGRRARGRAVALWPRARHRRARITRLRGQRRLPQHPG